MSLEFSIGSLAVLIVDMHRNKPEHDYVNYFEYIQSREWKRKAKAAKARADHRCQVCNSSDRLEVHHRTYINLGHENRNDLTVLCHDCHDLFSRGRKLNG